MSRLRATLVEALLIGAGGLCLGLLGNAVSPAGLRIGRDYFPRGAERAAEASGATPPGATPQAHGAADAATGSAPPAAASAAEALIIEHLAEHGLDAIRFEEARALYLDPSYAPGGLLFIDARRDEDYAAGHVPLALQFDHYRAERHLDAVMQAAPGTSRIVVYCNGGNCEDSEFAATTLKDFLPDPGRICVYVGGIEEWTARGMPLETGERGSGVLLGGQP
ncbi:MAG TPA: rhodanese-like domain-containing protein [Planctomycetota bacterium]|nr:rhodanese-like domain-containing protein [Planctomycetota bacterium]